MDGCGNGRLGCHRRGQWAAARQGVGGVDGLLGGQPAGLVDAAQVLLDELIHPEKCGLERAFRYVGVFGYPLHPDGADPIAVKQDCCDGLDPSTC
jgi:hypothetical protein